MFEGNNGAHIKLVGLLSNLATIFIVLFLIKMLVKFLKSRADNKKSIDK